MNGKTQFARGNVSTGTGGQKVLQRTEQTACANSLLDLVAFCRQAANTTAMLVKSNSSLVVLPPERSSFGCTTRQGWESEEIKELSRPGVT